MAKVYSHSESRAKGSVGMTTYRYVRGKVVQSQKIAPWDPAVEQVGNATRWNERTALLGLISLWCSAHAQSIINSFNRTKGGSQRNYFMKKNYAPLRMALNELAIEYAATKVAPDLIAIEDAIGAYAAVHPNTIYRIKKSGYDIVFLANNWDDADDPAKPVLIDSMAATLDSDYQMTKVVLIGSNLSQAIKMRFAGAPLDGVLAISAGGARAEFTPATAPVVIGDKELAAMVGSQVKKSIIVSGDQRDYYNLSLLVSPVGGGQVTGAGRYVSGASVPVSAVPNSGYVFSRWSDGDTNASRTVTISNDITLTAIFESNRFNVNVGAVDGVVAEYGTQINGVNANYDESSEVFYGDLVRGQQNTIKIVKRAEDTFGQSGDNAPFTIQNNEETPFTSISASILGNEATLTFNVPANFDDSYEWSIGYTITEGE